MSEQTYRPRNAQLIFLSTSCSWRSWDGRGRIHPKGWGALVALGKNRRFEVINKLGNVERIGVAGEQKIGEIAPHLHIYLFCTGHDHIAAIFDHANIPTLCTIFAIADFALVDSASKAALVNSAVVATGVSTRVIVT